MIARLPVGGYERVVLPPLPALTLHGSVLLLRRHAGVLVSRLMLEMVAASVLGWCLVSAWDRARSAASAASLAAALGIVLAGGGVYTLLRVIYRAGTIRVVILRLRQRREAGVFVEGAEAFTEAFASQYVLTLVDGAWLGCVLLELFLSAAIVHRPFGPLVAAMCIALTLTAGVLVSSFSTFVYVLSVLDGCTAAAAWRRLTTVLSAADARAWQRLIPLGLILLALGCALTLVDVVSSVGSWLVNVAQTPMVFVLVPFVSAGVSTVIDIAAAIFLSALTDRLPLGFAVRVNFTAPPGV